MDVPMTIGACRDAARLDGGNSVLEGIEAFDLVADGGETVSFSNLQSTCNG